MPHPLIEKARQAPLQHRMAAMRRAQDMVKREMVQEAKRRSANGQSNWGTAYRDLHYKETNNIPGFKHYADGVRRGVDNRVYR